LHYRILVGNKCDLSEQRQVTFEEGKSLAEKWKCPFFETSAKVKINSLECFHQAVRVALSVDGTGNAASNESKQSQQQRPKKRNFLCNVL
jgi:GTPase SAR1 family protein